MFIGGGNLGYGAILDDILAIKQGYSCMMLKFIHISPSLSMEYFRVILPLHFKHLGSKSISLDSSIFISDLSYIHR